jgi:hypothetical protein
MMRPRLIHRIRPGYPSWLTQDRLRKLRDDWNVQRWNAKVRNIAFELSFGEWLSIWLASGKLLRRGRGQGQYCMARHHDRGDYTADNVSIVLAAENNATRTISEETRCLLSLAAMLQQYGRDPPQAVLAARLEARP